MLSTNAGLLLCLSSGFFLLGLQIVVWTKNYKSLSRSSSNNEFHVPRLLQEGEDYQSLELQNVSMVIDVVQNK